MSRLGADSVHSWEGLAVTLALGLGTLAGSGCAPEKPPEKPPEMLHLEHREPAPDASDVSVHAPIQARFEAPLDPESFADERVHLRTLDGAEIARTLQLSEDHRVLTVVPAAPFQPDQGYRLTFDPGLKSVDGLELDTDSAQWAWFVPEWLPLGEPLRSADDAFLGALSITFDSGGAPVVVGCEGDYEQHTSQLFARRWDGTAWQALGSPVIPAGEQCPFRLSLKSGPGGQLWLRGEKQDVWLATWDGTAWRQVWRSAPGVTSLFSLQVGPSNKPVSFVAGTVQRFSGGQWEDLGLPMVPAGKGAASSTGSALMLDEQERLWLAQPADPTAEMPNGSFRLSRWEDGAWNILGETPAPPPSFPTVPYSLSMIGVEVDPLGHPILAWYTRQGLCASRGSCLDVIVSQFTRWKDGTWEEAAPSRGGFGGRFAVGPSGELLIHMGGAIWRSSGGAWEQVASFSHIAGSESLVALDEAVSPGGVPYAVYTAVRSDRSTVRVAIPNR